MSKKKSPPYFIVLGFLINILIGTLILKLPISIEKNQTLTWVDSLFISTSAICVTGLVPIENIAETFTVFGEIVIALLIQIGGLGFVTIGVFILTTIGARIGISERYLVKDVLNQFSVSGIIKLVKTIVLTTLVIEFIGFIFNIISLYGEFQIEKLIGVSAFHAISSFNNAGFDIFESGLFPYKNHILFNINTSLMIILGGIGFIVIHDVVRKRSWKKLTIHSKIVIKMSIILILSGTLILKFTEGSNISWLQAYFQSVSTRTAGFSTLNLNILSNASILIVIILMFFGASPVSTGGGIKTTTVYTMFKSIISFAKGKKTLTYNRKINDDVKIRAFMLATLALFSIIFVTFILLVIEKNNHQYEANFTNILFEATSGFGTVGLSLGITPLLMPVSKVVLCFIMFCGRLGPLTIFSIWNRNYNKPIDNNIEYISENIIIG